ncbi:DUF6371 domain-containing protein [Fibrisoma limi]|uniref:DUF6371 domain-containing protein n=1 Tax=Fibrisoma limi TaxID=663275 RepID=UPI00031CBCAB|nr:DUF6371 domain-containing protein [Fibrisoma limi]
MNQHRYTLQPYKGPASRHTCPACEQPRQLSRYVDTETGELLPDHVGRCNRESNCGYHYTPRQYFEDNKIWKSDDMSQQDRATYSTLKAKVQSVPQPDRLPPSYLPFELFKQSLNHYDQNEFVNGLYGLFNDEITNDLISRFYIGTSKHWPGATVFWQIDHYGRIRTGKIMLYDPLTLKRIKQPFNHIDWVHSVLKKQGRLTDFELSQCLFGLHQLKDQPTNRPIAIVESEKTAILATVYLPEYIWLACGSLSNLTTEKLLPLSGRPVTLFPDLNGFEKWSQKAEELRPVIGKRLAVSDVLEKRATEYDRKKGYDLADYLIRNRDPVAGWALTDAGYPLFWDYQPFTISVESNDEPTASKAPATTDTQNEQLIEVDDCPSVLTLPLSMTERTLQRMNQRNPVLQKLIRTLDLVNPKTGEPFRLEVQ